MHCNVVVEVVCVFWWQKNAVASAADNCMTTNSVSILDEELRSKIEENARLHKQVKTRQLRKLPMLII